MYGKDKTNGNWELRVSSIGRSFMQIIIRIIKLGAYYTTLLIPIRQYPHLARRVCLKNHHRANKPYFSFSISLNDTTRITCLNDNSPFYSHLCWFQTACRERKGYTHNNCLLPACCMHAWSSSTVPQNILCAAFPMLRLHVVPRHSLYTKLSCQRPTRNDRSCSNIAPFPPCRPPFKTCMHRHVLLQKVLWSPLKALLPPSTTRPLSSYWPSWTR